jgi:hypothetical protein
MAVYKKFEPIHFTPNNPVEKHFHDHDETWVITKGACKAFMVDLDGRYSEFRLEEGDIWMVEAGVEHGCEPLGEGVWIFPFAGTIPVGSDKPVGHYYVEKEQYLPRLTLQKIPTDRYGREGTRA